MTDTEKTIDDQSQRETLKQRIISLEEETTALKEENEKLKSKLTPQQNHRMSAVSRRQMLGLFGGGALLGTAGTVTAGAQSAGKTENPFADEDHDHSGDILGQDVPVKDIRTNELNNVYIARPGTIQEKIDAAATDDGGYVRAVPEVYDPTAAFDVKKDVTLDMSGATVDFDANIDVFHVHAGGRIFGPTIVPPSGWTGAAYVADSGFSDSTYLAYQTTTVRGGYLDGTNGEGAMFRLHQSGDSQVTWTDFRSRAGGVGTVVDIHGESDSYWINSNVLGGFATDYELGIHIHGSGGLHYNRFPLSLQPESGAQTGWLLDGGSGNAWTGMVWDTQVYADGAWRITPNAGEYNQLQTQAVFPPEHVIDEKDDSSNALVAWPRLFGGTNGNPAIGRKAGAEGSESTTVGTRAYAGADGAIAFGGRSSATSNYGIADGHGATSSGNNAQARGRNAEATAYNAIAEGPYCENGIARTKRIGGGIDQLLFQAQSVASNTDLELNEMTIEADETNNQFVLKYKDSNGIIQIGTVSFN